VATFVIAAGGTAMVQFVIVDSGKRLELIIADQGTMEVGWATKIVTAPDPPPQAKPETR
jgi:hypothetical protein